MQVYVPEPFKEILLREPKLQGVVLMSLAEFEPWLRMSTIPFFPEYTDHGITHINEVIATASAIIREEAWSVVTAQDVAVLVIGILLHDCAMHIGEDAFASLVKPDSPRLTIDGFGDKSWPVLWVDFLGEASRFDARKLQGLFGDTEPVRNPGLEPKTWTVRDKLLIGEFLRRHHPRLAHEIAQWGVPGPTDKSLCLKEMPDDFADLAGLIARSHGQSIRSCLSYLRKYDLRQYRNVHAVFLMTLVRIADYLQVQSERAPQQVLKVRRLNSPVSQGEWKAHEAVRDIRNTHEDPEAVFVDAAPKDVKTYLKLKRLLGNIQEELDSSWSALGEVYGRYDGLNQLGLRLRRVRSNLDGEATFAKTVSYIPCKVAFEAADADLLKLLISPLYGNRPEIGIRELVQNSVDACRELQDYLQQRPELSSPELADQDGDVVITLEQDKGKSAGWLEISDRGIGMTVEVVQNYFLRAGASFRQSDVWRRLHERESHKARVLRSGRFGVGVLAAFLLGDEIEVSTRHIDVSSEEGITFKAKVDSSEIELDRYRRPVGTKIRIRISDPSIWKSLAPPPLSQDPGFFEAYKNLQKWDYYCLSEPRITRLFRSKGSTKVLKQGYSLPVAESILPAHWRRISDPDYSDIQWTYARVPHLICNGLIVESEYPREGYSVEFLYNEEGLFLQCPNLSVFDPDGHLPLLLQRTGLATRVYPFQESLLNDVVKDLIAYILVNAPTSPITRAVPRSGMPTGRHSLSSRYDLSYPGGLKNNAWLSFASAQDGTSPIDVWHPKTMIFDRILVLPWLDAAGNELEGFQTTPKDPIIAFGKLKTQRELRRWFRFVFGRSGSGSADDSYAYQARKGCRMLVSQDTFEDLRGPRNVSKQYWLSTKNKLLSNGWVLLISGECGDPLIEYDSLPADRRFEGITEWHISKNRAIKQPPSPLAIAWQEMIGTLLIPFDQSERKQKLHRVYEVLKDYIIRNEKLKEHSDKERKKSPTIPHALVPWEES